VRSDAPYAFEPAPLLVFERCRRPLVLRGNGAILKCADASDGTMGPSGIEHLGFQVEDVDSTLATIARLGGKPLTERVEVTPVDASTPQSYYEIKCLGPDAQIIDVSGSGWVGTD
jgi:hypothetical protein